MSKVELTDEELRLYRNYQDNCIKNRRYKNKLRVCDVVRISNEIAHDIGYRDQIGIVEGLSCLDNQVYVVAYDTIDKRYWSCRFHENMLEVVDKDIRYNMELYRAFQHWVVQNYPRDYILSKFRSNIVHVDFRNKERIK